MLRLMMNVKGKFPNKMIKQHVKSYENLKIDPHFVHDSLTGIEMKFKQYEKDPVSGTLGHVMSVVTIV